MQVFIERCKKERFFAFSLIEENYKLKEGENILEDDYPIYAEYVYIVDGHLVQYWVMDNATVGDIKQRFGVAEIRNAKLFS